MNPPKVSVIIPTYNRADLLPKAIDSVLRQTYTDFELIVVDDGSTDNTRELVEGIATRAPCPLLYVYQENRGEPAARNHGIATARGEYIAFLDSDDFWLPDHLMVCVAALDDAKSAGAVFTNHGITKDGSTFIPTVASVGKTPSDLLRRLATHELVLASDAVMIKHSVFDVIGPFNEVLLVGTDWEMWVRIASNYEMLYVPQLTVIVLQHIQNTSAHPRKIEENLPKAIQAILNHGNPEIAKLRVRMVARSHLDLGYFYAVSGNKRMAVRNLGVALRSDWRLSGDYLFRATVAWLLLGGKGLEHLRMLKHGRANRQISNINSTCSN